MIDLDDGKLFKVSTNPKDKYNVGGYRKGYKFLAHFEDDLLKKLDDFNGDVNRLLITREVNTNGKIEEVPIVEYDHGWVLEPEDDYDTLTRAYATISIALTRSTGYRVAEVCAQRTLHEKTPSKNKKRT